MKDTIMKIKYVRCSSIQQNLDRQLEDKEIKDKGCSVTFIKEGWTFTSDDTFANKTQELMLTIIGAIATAERITIRERVIQ